MSKKIMFTIGAILLIIIAFVGGYWVGRNNSNTKMNNSTTFYATIKEIKDNSLLVSGLEINDINSRGDFSFSIEDATILEWRHSPITVEDLEVGDTISVTYGGVILETYPAIIKGLIKIQLLEDEK